jgi:thiosulfate/3-mercaptopyruvate sulfurtransferase
MMEEIEWKYPEAIVSCEWLKTRLTDNSIRIFDCTTYLHYTDEHPSKPYDVESGFDNYKKGHIPGAAFFDIQEKLSNKESPFNFTIPNYDSLANTFQTMGVGNPFHIVLYATNAVQWATRVWWLIFILGFRRVSILDGGLKEWQRLGYDLEVGENSYNPARFESNSDGSVFVGKKHTLESINSKSCIILNALTNDLHRGENPRYGRPGRIPGSANIPFHQLLEENTHKLVTPIKALEVIKGEKINKDTRVLNYCGGGIAATLNAFVLRQLGIEDLEIYDNSMSEWAMDYSLPIETTK